MPYAEGVQDVRQRLHEVARIPDARRDPCLKLDLAISSPEYPA